MWLVNAVVARALRLGPLFLYNPRPE